MTTAYLGLGSNLGDRERYLRAAIAALGRAGRVSAASALYETEPEGGVAQPRYLNAVVRLETRLGPRALLESCLRVERALGRHRPAGARASRSIDIDILLYGDRCIDEPGLEVPHPRLLARPFVRIPLAEAASPGLCHPSSRERLDRSRPDAGVRRLDGAAGLDPPGPGGQVPEPRIRRANAAPVRGEGEWVLYWMTAAHRTRFSFALERAVDWARDLGKPLVVLELLRADYPYASDRLHTFYLQGMADNARRLARSPVTYHPFVAEQAGTEAGLVEALAARACVTITDDFPHFFLPAMVAALAPRLSVLLEQVDGNGLLPMRAADRVFTSAFSFRRWLQGELGRHLLAAPREDPLRGARLPRLDSLPAALVRRWPRAREELLRAETGALARLPIDHGVAPGLRRGGGEAARRCLREFVAERLPRYAEDRNHPDRDATSGLSPYLHFGHVSSHEILRAVAEPAGWTPDRLASRAGGRRSGFWGLGANAEAFLDQLVTWRELGFNHSALRGEAHDYQSLPEWARRTLERHANDRRPALYTLAELDGARTADALWNAAQRQLVREGRLHNYLRMLWGKRILEWSPGPQRALEIMFELNDRYALDGRDPNSASGIAWVLGRYDHPWPERPVFGTVRSMSSERTARKVEVREYLRRYG